MYLKLIEFIGNIKNTDDIENLLSSWVNNGQVISIENTIFNASDNIKIVSVFCPDEESLENRWNNIYVNNWQNTIKLYCEIKIKNLGSLNNVFLKEEEWSSCKYIVVFFSQYFLMNPIRDGQTLNPIPLYFLPKTSDDNNYQNLLSISKVYNSFNEIEDFSSTQQKEYLDELYNLDSTLNRSVIELCKKIEKLVNKPVFFYQYHYTYETNIESELNRILNNNNTFIDIDNEYFQLINISDRIVSNITPNLLEEARDHYKNNKAISELEEFKSIMWDNIR